ncbi:MAG: 2-keto-4-pentenoate hydratase [Alphaproteobacteria bacterium]
MTELEIDTGVNHDASQIGVITFEGHEMGSARVQSQVISDGFVAARRSATALAAFPGVLPETLAEAYAVQNKSLARWPEPVAGWKIGMIAPPLRARFGEERLAGPIFGPRVQIYRPGSVAKAALIKGGYGAIEAEFILRLAVDVSESAPIDSEDALAGLVAAMHVGVELAGSPFKGINDLGPTSVISDFGNNAGLIVGPTVSSWRTRPLSSLTVRTIINGAVAGEGRAANVLNGPLAALKFLIENCRERQIALRAGQYVSTGAVTGIHDVTPPATSTVDYGPFGKIEIEVIEAKG